MKKLINIIKVMVLTLPVMALFGGFSSCSDPNDGELFVTPSDSLTDLTVIDVMESEKLRDADYSMWLELLKKTNYYNSLKNANAVATVFCPTNDAMKQFLAERGVSSIDELDLDYAKAVVMSHIIADNKYSDAEIDTAAQQGTSIKAQNLYDAYINLSYGYKKLDVDDAEKTDEVHCPDSIFINNQARLGRFEGTTCKNGVFYQMASVIKPVAETIYQSLKNNSDYSIFAQAMQDCGYDSVANKYSDTTYVQGGSRVINKHTYTCFAVPDYIYKQNGINSVQDLQNYLSSHGTNDADLTHYMQYHFLKRMYKTSELFSFMTDSTTNIFEVRMPGQCLITNKLLATNQNVINKDIPVIRSDIEARNGYINKVGGVMPVYLPDPVNVKWDFLNQEDIIAFVNAYGASQSLGDLFSEAITGSEYKIAIDESKRDGEFGTLTSFSYKNESTKANTTSYRIVGFYKEKYKAATNPTVSQYGSYMNNYLCLNLGYAGWIQFTTPSIIQGKYKVVLHYLSDAMTQKNLYSAGSNTQFKIDNDFVTTKPLFKGAKYSQYKTFLTLDQTLFGSAEFNATSTHTFKITMMDIQAKNLASYHQFLDYVEFIPIQ